MPIRRRSYSRDPQNGEPVGIDDYTGFKVPLSSLKKDWKGLMADAPDRRNPQDYVRGIPDKMALPFSRPESPDVFIAQPLRDQAGAIMLDQAGRVILDQGVVAVL